jgi:3-oxoacyl-[acyl-carrier protein] reductase
MDFGLRGQVLLITGGASGIGRGIAVAFAKQGVHVALTYMSSAAGAAETVAEIESYGVSALAMQADLTKEDVVESVVAQTIERFGKIDTLITNSGGLLQRTSVQDCSLELWNQAFAVNVTSMFLCCRAVIPHMIKAGKGNIITMSSLAAHNGGGAGATHYAATKGAVLTFTRGLAKELGPKGIRVNGVAPGLIGTQFHDRFSTAESRRNAVAQTPLGREGTPDDVAGVALFLASDNASFLTGETIEINGGQGMY